MPRTPPPPLDPAALERLALRYVERFATTRGRLADYLHRKLRERGWAGEGAADPPALAARMVALGYVDDRAFGEAKAAAMARRGLGARRVAGALREARLDEGDRAALAPQVDGQAEAAALAFARRRRLGPFAAAPADRALRERQLAAMLRAGHPIDLARRILARAPGDGDADDMIEDSPARFGHCDDGQPC